MNRILKRRIHYLFDKSKRFPEICTHLSSPEVTLRPPITDVKDQMAKIISDSKSDQNLLVSKVVELRQEQFLAKISKFLPVLNEITSKLETDVIPVPVGKYAAMLDGSDEISFALVQAGTWPSLFGAESVSDEQLKEAFQKSNSEWTKDIVEHENRFVLQNGSSVLKIIRRDFVLNYTLAAEWIHYCVRVNPLVPTFLQILLSWLKSSKTEMDEEIFIHFVLFYLVHRSHIQSLESLVNEIKVVKSGEVIIPPPDQTSFFNGPPAPLSILAPDFFKFLKTFDAESLFLNTFNGEIGTKAELDVEDSIWQHHHGLTILHPFYPDILLLPTE